MRILLVEDEEALGAVIRQGLEAARYHVDWAQDGIQGQDRALRGDYDLIVLDLMLPGRDGWGICETLRTRRVSTPILMLTARGDVDDRVRGLELGADDYLAKPFAFKELRARIHALLRRERVHKARVIRVADLTIDTACYRVERGGREVELTPRQYALLEALAAREGEVLSREVILGRVFSDPESTSNTVEVHIAALRRKIDAGHPVKLIHTIYGRGYSLRVPGAGEW